VNVQTVNCQEPNAGRQFVTSLRETGFAVLKNHPISRTLLENLYRDWLEFFHGDEKHAYLFDPENRDGTQAGFHPITASETAVGYATKDLKEFFHVVPGAPIPPALQHDILHYRQLALNFCATLLEWVQAHTPAASLANLVVPLPQVLSSSMSLLRILHYPPLQGSEDPRAVRAAPHEDINLLTLLPVALQPGLQVQNTNGDWIDLDSLRGEIIVNTGDMLREASAGYFPSTTHRVVNPPDAAANVSRISIPFFITPHADCVLSDRYTAGSYLDERLRLISA
jgi:isopenicillin N synthase-like dioxygenase